MNCRVLTLSVIGSGDDHLILSASTTNHLVCKIYIKNPTHVLHL